MGASDSKKEKEIKARKREKKKTYVSRIFNYKGLGPMRYSAVFPGRKKHELIVISMT